MKQYKGAIFDLDGTLLDSMRVWDDIDVTFLKKRGLEVPPDYQEAITPLGFLEAARYTIRRFGFPETPEELIQEWHQMAVDAYTYEVELKDGAAEYLRYLKEKGIRMAVATSSSPELYEPALKRNGIYEYFKAFVTVSEVKRGKGFSHKFIVFHGIKKLFIGYHNDFVCMCTLTGISKCNLSVISRHMDIISGTHSSNIHQLMAALINKKFRRHHTTLIVIAFNS